MDTFAFVFLFIMFMFLHNFNHIVNEIFCAVSGRILTLSYVKPRGLREAIYDEFEGLGCGVHRPCQFLNTAAPNLALHTLSQACTPNLVCIPTHNGQKSGEK